jgi:HEPN domain-containing protein
MTDGTELDSIVHILDGPDDWIFYPMAYWDAAERLLHDAHENGLLIQPGMFLLRHFVELTLKELIHRARLKVPGTHDLTDIWDLVRSLPSVAANEHVDAALLGEITSVVQQLSELDGKSFAFRYPVDKAGKPHGIAGGYSSKEVVAWAEGVHDTMVSLEGALEMAIHRSAVRGGDEGGVRTLVGHSDGVHPARTSRRCIVRGWPQSAATRWSCISWMLSRCSPRRRARSRWSRSRRTGVTAPCD